MRGSLAPVRGVLLDLDGTLADTAPGVCGTLNMLRAARGLAPLPLRELRPHVSAGVRGMLECGLGMTPEHPQYPATWTQFLDLYGAGQCTTAALFDGMADALTILHARGIRWGIVTNKPLLYAAPLLDALGLAPDAGCLVTPDGLRAAKPDPDGVLKACALLETDPAAVAFVGDDARDIAAGRAAGTRTIVALWGYLAPGVSPVRWGASALLAAPAGLPGLLERWG